MAPSASDEDIVVQISEGNSPSGKTTPTASPLAPAAGASGAAARAKEWLGERPRNKYIAGGTLAGLLLLPVIIAPAVVASQQRGPKLRVPNWGAFRTSGDKTVYYNPLGNPDAGRSGGGAGVAPGMKIPNFGSLADAAATIKVPKATPRRKRPTDDAGLMRFATEAPAPFVRVDGDQFDKDCRPFYPTGFNAYELFILAAEGKRDVVDAAFRSAAAMGMTAARTWAHTVHEGVPFQTAPGVYDERGLEALDYVLDSAARHGVQLILSFIDQWKYANGVAQYVDWCSSERTLKRPVDVGGDSDESKWTPEQKRYETARNAAFFSEPRCKEMYKAHVRAIVERKNSINGRTYRDDPTIIAWNLINEPRCESWVSPENDDCAARLNAWFGEMARHVKGLDPNHLVSTGSEGFFGTSDASWVGQNPGDWAPQTGQDFFQNSVDMDFLVAHAWPDNWMIPEDRQGAYLKEWLDSHLAAARLMGKPLLFEEFGKSMDSDSPSDIEALRDPVYEATYDAIEAAVENNEPLLGSMYWKWAFPGASVHAGAGKGPYGVAPSDSTMKVIRDHSARMYKLMGSVPPRPSCMAPNGTAADAPGAVGAWFPTAGRKCVNDPQAALAWHSLYGPDAAAAATPELLGLPAPSLERAKQLEAGGMQVFPTRAACCAPNRGAFAAGCA
ncbi:mannan endo-1,4-beta-mannosidase [Raphidocelis subcapitata]|uniref:mannan endo-1,4-beta-mannosidase n=1 Tax=Raphidocelis subcapitata TaxID=307507 RepID=A0A2V0NSQ1_9CHLO|nr:mannan endo-1,4-beta-mannosidase [Raphidocelis subcapitata]|eukprot:GBF87865.1 mannan endo-1,4-beta-mannosidase [Raphidocelis subcapitata]